jgi:Kef-type K+ transport system membrane component KefB
MGGGIQSIESAGAAAPSSSFGGRRLVAGYVVVAALVAVAASVSIVLGHDEHPAPAVAGFYSSASTCLGSNFKVSQSGEFVDLGGGPSGKLRLGSRHLKGNVRCAKGGSGSADLAVLGKGATAKLVGTIGARHVSATFGEPLPAPGASAKPPPKRTSEETFGRLMLAIASVILAARLVGALISRLSQPRVMGEVLAGILLGPTLLGAVWPEAKDYLFPPDIVPLLSAGASIGLAFYLFLVGMELDPRMLRARIGQAAFISNTSVGFPMALGFIVALPLYRILAPDVRYLPFALFMAVAMSITAFPVLARILTEHRMLKRPVGALTMAGAAIDDVTAWGLLALATAAATTGSGLHAVQVVGLTAVFAAGMLLVGRPLLGRVSRAYDEVGRVPTVWLGIIFVGVLLSAYVTQSIGVAAIFGAFLVGLIMPRDAGLTEDVRGRFEDFVVAVLLPLFFVVTGLKTDVGSLNRPVLWLLTLLLIGVAIAGKWVGAMAAARYGGFSLRDSAAIGALMNTRGLTELIVLNIGLNLGMISPELFTMLVVMALVTTFMAGPALRLIDPRRELSEPPEEELRQAARVGGVDVTAAAELRSILVAPQDARNLEALLALAVPLARSTPARELVIAEVVVPDRYVTGVLYDQRDAHAVSERLNERRKQLTAQGVATRATAFTSVLPGSDYVRMAAEEEVDLILLDGRRPLLGGGVPRGTVGEVLQKAPCDVAVLVEREGVPQIDADRPVYVPFGGASHDWAAVELAAWIASVRDAPLRLIGAAAGPTDDAGRRLAQVALVVQQLAEIHVEPLVVDLSHVGVVRATSDAGLLVIGLSERWREEGLGDLRSAIARKASAPILFVRRGTRAGALSSEEVGVTRFSWSRAGGGIPA